MREFTSRGNVRTSLLTARPLNRIRIVGGRVCLDFVNTIHDRFAPIREDYIANTDRYLAWSRQVGVLSNAEHARLLSMRSGECLMGDVRKFREELYAFLLGYIRGRAYDSILPVRTMWLGHNGLSTHIFP